jgi:uncharacterized Zn finger protein (UPF0148 family)
MTEYGLSVSLEGTPRTPVAASGAVAAGAVASDGFDGEYYCCAPPRMHHSRMKLGGDSDDDDGHEDDSIESISPRVLFPEVEVRRRLDFSSLSLSPIVPRSSPPPLFTERILVCDDDCSSACCSVGECGVCYTNLPLRANHIFTMCGHLFCVRCVFKWWDTATTCPICRAELFQHEAEPVVEVAAPAPEEADEAEAEAEEAVPAAAAERNDNDGVLLGREYNNRYGGLISSDSESDTTGVEAPEEVAEDAVLRLWDSERVSSYVRNIARAIRREHWYNNYNGGTVSSDSESDSAIDFT